MGGRVHEAGGRLTLMHHTDVQLVSTAKLWGMTCIPGAATPSEAFAALRNGADALQLFPAETLPPQALKAWRTVIPEQILILPVGGVTPDNMQAYWEAGASGFGLDSALFKPGLSPAEIAANARRFAMTAAALGDARN